MKDEVREATSDDDRVREWMKQTAAIERALRLAVMEALWEHKIHGNPVAMWENGMVVWVPPEAVEVDLQALNPDS